MQFLKILLLTFVLIVCGCVYFAESHGDRNKRFLIYEEGNSRVQWIMGVGVPVDLEDETVIIGIVLKAYYLLPTNASVYTNPDTVYARKKRSMSRWDIYGLLSEAADLYGYGGRSCILRTVCEAADTVIDKNHGLLNEIAHAVFTSVDYNALDVGTLKSSKTIWLAPSPHITTLKPTTTDEEISHHTDNEYYAAHQIGTTIKGRCQDFFPDCKVNFMDMFTKIRSI